MGGHGGLNILPQKKWNVYNFENREKVRLDEEAAAREEQLQREDTRRREAEFRLEHLRRARKLPTTTVSVDSKPQPQSQSESSSDAHHINLFEGLADFASLVDGETTASGKDKNEDDAAAEKRSNKRKREEKKPASILPEDEKYRLGYGLAGKGVKAPWYLSGSSSLDDDFDDKREASGGGATAKKSGQKKTIEELREERMKRERQEKERERSLLAGRKKGAERGFSRRRT